MSFQIIESVGKPIKAWTRGVPVEAKAKQQLQNIATMPFIYKHVAVMPDCHYGMGATVGTVIATQRAIIPAAVGVDIGCGMMYQRTSLTAADLPDSLAAIRSAIESVVPHGRTDNGGANDRGSWNTPPKTNEDAIEALHTRLTGIVLKHPKLSKHAGRISRHAGTLGGGNHFIELVLDEEDRVGIMLHSGSRGIGNAIGTYFIDKAKEEMARWFITVPDTDLSYLPEGSTYFKDYCEAVRWAQEFAYINRCLMMNAVVQVLADKVGKPFTLSDEVVACHHNYVSWEKHFGQAVIVTRKGAVNAELGVMGIIPGSMGAKSFIVRGKGNPDSFNSCSHGAGRVMSRGEANRTFTVEDHMVATQGVECKKDASVIDETPKAYKDIDAVMAAQADLVEIVHTVKQVLCVKG